MPKKVMAPLAVIVAVLAVIISLQPSEFHVLRSTVITAPPEVVFDQVNDLHKWKAWSPWAKLDTKAKESFEGPSSGTGATMSWAGNKNVGEGSMTIVESRPYELIRFDLKFLKPFKGNHIAEFTFKADGDKTAVTWSMSGKNGFMGKAMGLVMNCDKLIGEQFENGLADMKTISEGLSK